MSLLLLFQNRAGADQAILLSAVRSAESAGMVSAQRGAVGAAPASIASSEHHGAVLALGGPVSAAPASIGSEEYHGVTMLSAGEFLRALIRAYPAMLGSPAYREALVAVVTQYGALLGGIGQHDD